MIDYLEQHTTTRSVVPTTPKQHIASAIFEMWGDEWLLIPAMHYRWNHNNFPFIYEEFGEIVLPGMPAFVKRFVGKKLGGKFKRFVPLLGITEHSIPAIEHWYENEVLVQLNNHFKIHDYLLGNKPCVGDFGLMGPLYAHLYRDPASGKIMKAKAPYVVKWVERMNQTNVPTGEYLANDTIPDTLKLILLQQFKEFWPVQINSVLLNQKWIEENPDKAFLPRIVGYQDFTIGDVTEERAVSSFSQWKVQRVVDLYNNFNSDEQSTVREWLADLDGHSYFEVEFKHRVTRKNNRLVVDR